MSGKMGKLPPKGDVKTLGDSPNRKLGKLPAKTEEINATTLNLANYFLPTLPPPPSRINWSKKAAYHDWPWFLNNQLSDCTISSSAHMLMVWTGNTTGTPVIATDAQITKAYADVSGYNPDYGWNDNGAYLLDVMNYWRNTGIAGHKINNFVYVNPRNRTHMKQAMYYFGAVNLGLNLPQSAMGQTGYNMIWEVPDAGAFNDGEPGSWGGHSVAMVSYDTTGVLCATWGQQQFMTWKFLETYSDEAYVALSPDWVCSICNRCPIGGINMQNLTDDLNAVAN
jgi:hypothetical protein